MHLTPTTEAPSDDPGGLDPTSVWTAKEFAVVLAAARASTALADALRAIRERKMYKSWGGERGFVRRCAACDLLDGKHSENLPCGVADRALSVHVHDAGTPAKETP